jgi:hypothetical protein
MSSKRNRYPVKNLTPTPAQRNLLEVKTQTKSGVQVHEISLDHVELPTFDNALIRFSVADWVDYGADNLFPDFLIECAQKSSRHSAYLNLRRNCIKGGKVGPVYSDDLKPFLENIDGQGCTLKKLVDLWAQDLSILETFGCFVLYNKKGEIAEIHYIDSSKIRVEKPRYTAEDIEAGVIPEITHYRVCDDWSLNPRANGVVYPKFNPSPRDARGNIVKPRNSTEVFFFHRRALRQPYYPQVSYLSCLNHVLAQEQLGRYGLTSLLNNFFASAIFHMIAPGMSDEDQTALKAAIDRKFSGVGNAAKSMLIVGEDEKNTFEVKPVQVGDNTELVESIRAQAESAIDVAHRCRPELVGVPSSGGLSSDGSSIGPSMQIFQNNVIDDLQGAILDFLHDVLRHNGYKNYDLDIAQNVLVTEPAPAEWIQANIKREAQARHYGWKETDLVDIEPVAPAPALDTPVADAEVAIDNTPGQAEPAA